MLSRSNTRERLRIEPEADGIDVGDKGTLRAADSLHHHWPEYFIAIVLSPSGKKSSAYFNPAVTLTFYQLREVALWDAVFYCAAQFLGAVAGVRSPHWCCKVRRRTKRSVTLQPHPALTTRRSMSTPSRLFGELAVSFILMGAILFASIMKSWRLRFFF